MRVVLADDNRERGDAVAVCLRAAGATEIVRLTPGESLVAAVQARSAEIVVLDLSRPDRDHLETIRTLIREAPRPIIVFVDHDDAEFMDAAIAAGVCSYNVVGRALPEMKPIVQAAVAIFRRYRRLTDTLATAETKLAERAIIQRAKLRLKEARGLSEPAAHRWLRRTAMSRGKRMVDIAAELLAESEADEAGDKVNPGAAQKCSRPAGTPQVF